MVSPFDSDDTVAPNDTALTTSIGETFTVPALTFSGTAPIVTWVLYDENGVDQSVQLSSTTGTASRTGIALTSGLWRLQATAQYAAGTQVVSRSIRVSDGRVCDFTSLAAGVWTTATSNTLAGLSWTKTGTGTATIGPTGVVCTGSTNQPVSLAVPLSTAFADYDGRSDVIDVVVSLAAAPTLVGTNDAVVVRWSDASTPTDYIDVSMVYTAAANIFATAGGSTGGTTFNAGNTGASLWTGGTPKHLWVTLREGEVTLRGSADATLPALTEISWTDRFHFRVAPTTAYNATTYRRNATYMGTGDYLTIIARRSSAGSTMTIARCAITRRN